MKNNLYLIALLALAVSCKKDYYFKDPYNKIKAEGKQPAWGPTITPQMLAVIEALDSIAPYPVYRLTPADARRQQTPGDAVLLVMKKFGITQLAPMIDTIGKNIPVTGGNIHVRIYKPGNASSNGPAIVYYHGGGWVIATIDTYDASANALAEKTGATVISVEYRKGPEYKFPTAHNDAFAAYKWVINNAGVLSIDPKKVAVAGESAGGNLAIAVSMMARDSAVQKPVYQVAIYPVASNDPDLPTKKLYTNAKPLATPALPWFLGHYLASPAQSSLPWISLVNANLKSLPNTTIIGAEIDPLQSDGTLLSAKLTGDGNRVSYHLYPGVTHEFFGMSAVVPEAKDAQDIVASDLKKAFWK